MCIYLNNNPSSTTILVIMGEWSPLPSQPNKTWQRQLSTSSKLCNWFTFVLCWNESKQTKVHLVCIVLYMVRLYICSIGVIITSTRYLSCAYVALTVDDAVAVAVEAFGGRRLAKMDFKHLANVSCGNAMKTRSLPTYILPVFKPTLPFVYFFFLHLRKVTTT